MWIFGNTLFTSLKTKSSIAMMLIATITLLSTSFVTADGKNGTNIKIHGDWEITVYNADGSVAQERSFANGLVDTGANLMAGLLSGKMLLNYNLVSKPAWDIAVVKNGVDKAACTRYDEAIDKDPRLSGTRHADVEDGPDGEFTLTRTMVIGSECIIGESYNITGVHTLVAQKPGLDSPDELGYAWFSSKTLDAPITGILPEQSVTLKVRYSFQ